MNVHPVERAASAIIGGLMTYRGAARRDLPGAATAAVGAALALRGLTGHCFGYALMGRSTTTGAKKPSASPSAYNRRGIHVDVSMTIARRPDELYAFWRNFENLPRFMKNIEAVRVVDARRSHWIARGPVGTDLTWDAEVIADEPGRLISWRTLGHADVDSTGTVKFVAAPGERGTEVRVVMDYIPPLGKAGAMLAKVAGADPAGNVREDLRRLKQIFEAGEIPTTDGQPRGARC